MKIAVFQFEAQCQIDINHTKIIEAIKLAARKQVRLLVFQECAACGYPPIEVRDIKQIDFNRLSKQMDEIKHLAKEYNMYIALGTIEKDRDAYFNIIYIIDSSGETLGKYAKRALWGWDIENFNKGNELGIYEIDGVKVGFRICFEIRFPEYFRELFESEVELCFVSFCDVSKEKVEGRYDIIKAHLITRAVENVMTVVSVNSISNYQTAPTAVFNPDGKMIMQAPLDKEYLMVYDYQKVPINFSQEGRIQNAYKIMKNTRRIRVSDKVLFSSE